MNNMAVGAGLSLSYSKLKSPPGSIIGAVTSTSFSFSPFARYYIHNFFGQATFGLGTQTPVNSTLELKKLKLGIVCRICVYVKWTRCDRTANWI
jgi:hypothetical protein